MQTPREIRTYHFTQPFGVVDRAKIARFDDRARLLREGIPHAILPACGSIVEMEAA